MSSYTYTRAQNTWLKLNRVGRATRLKVVRTFNYGESGFTYGTAGKPNPNQILYVYSFHADCVKLSDGLRYPFFVLEVIK